MSGSLLILVRAGMFSVRDEDIQVMTVCPAHCYGLGLCWRPSRAHASTHYIKEKESWTEQGVGMENLELIVADTHVYRSALNTNVANVNVYLVARNFI